MKTLFEIFPNIWSEIVEKQVDYWRKKNINRFIVNINIGSGGVLDVDIEKNYRFLLKFLVQEHLYWSI